MTDPRPADRPTARPSEHPELAETTDGTILSLHVQPGAKRSGLAGHHGGALRVRVSAPPTEGRANDEVVALLATTFGMPRSAVRITAGASNRRKRVLLVGITLADAAAAIDRAIGKHRSG